MDLVERRTDPEDRRATIVAITDAGKRARGQARKLIDATLEEMWATHLSAEEAELVVEVMDRVLEANHGIVHPD